MRLFSSPSEVAAQTGDAAWLRAMLDFEAALAGALAEVGLADASAAEEIARVCGEGWDDGDAAGGSGPAGGATSGVAAAGAVGGPAAAAWDLDALRARAPRGGHPGPQ